MLGFFSFVARGRQASLSHSLLLRNLHPRRARRFTAVFPAKTITAASRERFAIAVAVFAYLSPRNLPSQAALLGAWVKVLARGRCGCPWALAFIGARTWSLPLGGYPLTFCGSRGFTRVSRRCISRGGRKARRTFARFHGVSRTRSFHAAVLVANILFQLIGTEKVPRRFLLPLRARHAIRHHDAELFRVRANTFVVRRPRNLRNLRLGFFFFYPPGPRVRNPGYAVGALRFILAVRRYLLRDLPRVAVQDRYATLVRIARLFLHQCAPKKR